MCWSACHTKTCLNFFFYQSPLHLCMVFDSISFDIDEFLLINSSPNLFAFGDFIIHHKDLLTYSSGTDRTVELCYQIALLSWLIFLLRSLTVTLTIMLFWIYFFLVMLVFVLQWLSLQWEILIMLLSWFPLTFYQTQNRMPCFIA